MAEYYNGGISITVGGVTLKYINSYSPSWSPEEGETFESWDFTTVYALKGYRFKT